MKALKKFRPEPKYFFKVKEGVGAHVPGRERAFEDGRGVYTLHLRKPHALEKRAALRRVA